MNYNKAFTVVRVSPRNISEKNKSCKLHSPPHPAPLAFFIKINVTEMKQHTFHKNIQVQ